MPLVYHSMASTARPRRHCKLDTRFVQREAITTCIRNNINEYGGGTVCLKEMLANSDDAKATRFTVCLDKSSYQRSKLLDEKMAPWQGPAVIVHNDALFTDEDCEAYTRKVGDSSKLADANTVGKFGKGAMTAYYLSDGIQCLSGNHLLILDPHETHLPDQLASVRGELVHPEHEHYMGEEFSGHITPFSSFTKACPAVAAMTVGPTYPGTLFRLALRTASEATASSISRTAIRADDFAETTLKEFATAAPDLLLFTTHVKEIFIYSKATEDSTAELLHHSKASHANMTAPSSVSQLQMQKVTVSTQDQEGSHSSRTWARALSVAPAQSRDGVAALLQQAGQQAKDRALPSIDGKVFVTLPMPFSVSGLPIHINGAFWIQSDRRKLWSGENDGGRVSHQLSSLYSRRQKLDPCSHC